MKRWTWASFFLLLGGVCWAAESSTLLEEGLRLANDGKASESLVMIRRAAAAAPSDAATQTALGLVALQNQNLQEARGALERAVQLDPNSQTAFYSLAMLYEKLKMGPEARSAWQRFLSLSPSAEMAELARRHVERLQ
ncbi:MAG: tetratricopeptide repeat protein [Elusimicrobia bacterium]|nr:tetratricopeptide repeat protein [Elusimicrobiota bacterium]